MPHRTESTAQLSGAGRVSGSLHLSGAGLSRSSVSSNVTGAQVITSSAGTDSTDLVDFGELSRGSGEKLAVTIGFVLRGNSSYRLNVSESSFNAVTLEHKREEVVASANRASFVEIRAGNVFGTGARSNPSGTVVNGALQTGMRLSELSQGPVTADSTRVCEGDAPSIGGNSSSSDNAIEIPLYFSVPTGLDLGPSRGASRGHFQVTVQVGVFAGR